MTAFVIVLAAVLFTAGYLLAARSLIGACDHAGPVFAIRMTCAEWLAAPSITSPGGQPA